MSREGDEVALLPSPPATVSKKHKQKNKGKFLSNVWGDDIPETH